MPIPAFAPGDRVVETEEADSELAAVVAELVLALLLVVETTWL